MTVSSSPNPAPAAPARLTRKQRRLILIATAAAVLGLAAGVTLYGLSSAITFSNSPSELVTMQPAPGTRIRLGGLVENGSVEKGADLRLTFRVTDGAKSVTVAYQGILPDLFREGQGVVAEGRIEPGGVLRADTILARHDENYMPKEVADALKKQGHWKPGDPAPNPNAPRR